jgi:hypothetical protein
MMTFAGVPGLEPRLTEPESVVLPITPYPTRCPLPDPPSGPEPAPGTDISRPRVPVSTRLATAHRCGGSAAQGLGYPPNQRDPGARWERAAAGAVQPHPCSPASRAPSASVSSRSPTCTAWAGRTSRTRHALRKIARCGMATPSSPEISTASKADSSPSAASFARWRSPAALVITASRRPRGRSTRKHGSASAKSRQARHTALLALTYLAIAEDLTPGQGRVHIGAHGGDLEWDRRRRAQLERESHSVEARSSEALPTLLTR